MTVRKKMNWIGGQKIRRIAPSRLRIGPEHVNTFGDVAHIESQGCFRSEGRHCHGAEKKSYPMQRHSHFVDVLPETFPIINGRSLAAVLMSGSMSELGQNVAFDPLPVTSGLPQRTDIVDRLRLRRM
jgi:hypothetical protein